MDPNIINKIISESQLPACDIDIPKPNVAAAKWRDHLEQLRAGFPSPWDEEKKDQLFENAFKKAVELLNEKKHSPRGKLRWRSYLGNNPSVPDYQSSYEETMSQEMIHYDEVVQKLITLFEGMPIWNHPQTMINVVPPSNTAAILGATLAEIFSPNIIEGDYSWNVAKTEIQAAAMVAELLDWDQKAGGVFTFGGTGCYLYGTKYALTRCLGRESRYKGIREDVKILVSEQGHYCKQNCTDWTGLGMDNIIDITTGDDNRMDVPALKQALEECYGNFQKVAMVVCTMGTTDAFAVDPIVEVREVIDEFKARHNTNWPLLYADAVIGWSWLAFKNYDFDNNPLQFCEKALKANKANFDMIEHLGLADAIGCDFHKTGWAPYNCSLFMAKDFKEFEHLMERPVASYLQPKTDYNPGHYTLETSRSGNYSTAGWATLKFLGYEGFQVMLGHITEVQIFLRDCLKGNQSLVCVNPEDHGFVTLFRVYPKGIDAETQYHNEFHNPEFKDQLYYYNKFQKRVANKLFDMVHDPECAPEGWACPPQTNYTAGFRPPLYEVPDSQYFVYALKSYPMSPNSDEISMILLVSYVLKARDLVEQEIAEECKCKLEGRKIVRKSLEYWGSNDEIPEEYMPKG